MWILITFNVFDILEYLFYRIVSKVMRIIMFLFFLFATVSINAQTVTGKVFERLDSGEKSPLPGANLYWLNTTKGTTSLGDGGFELDRVKGNNKLIISYIGYKTDTLSIEADKDYIEIIMRSGQDLDEIVVVQRKRTAYMDVNQPIVSQVVTGEELCKAACCNLGESFETNASVDVSYADAATGAKQIQMLGLTGQYIQMMTENMSNFRGLASKFGLNYIPGAWMDAISISKGTGSVINGYESVAGQISVDYKKPESSEKFFINGYANDASRFELNSNFSINLSDKWSTMFMLHGSKLNSKQDDNNDGFVDMPLVEQINLINRWIYKDDYWNIQFGAKILDEDRTGGQVMFDKKKPRDKSNGYGINLDTRRYEGFMKVGYLMPDYENTSMALLINLSDHKQDSYYGLRDYYGRQKSANINYIFQSIFGDNPNQQYSAGLSYMYDKFDEKLSEIKGGNLVGFGREEKVFGGFFQYTGIFGEMFTAMAGLRYDNHNLYGSFFTPRLHLKFSPDEHTSIRGSIGLGYRSANVVAENNIYLGSSRDVYVNGLRFAENPEAIAGLDMEKAINYGLNINRKFDLFGRTLNFNAEYYRTDFKNQVIIDLDTDHTKLQFDNLDGKSYSNSYQAEIKYEMLRRLETTVAYRYNDVKQTINGELVEPALRSRYKGLLNFSYTTNMKVWQFDYTFQFNGPGRMPNSSKLPEEYQTPEEFDSYTVMNAQVTKWFRRWSIYVGCENLGNFKQDNPIVAADRPFDSDYFDTSKVWGPIDGRKFYIGFRFAIDRE